ncbi:MAG TPA: YtxH domain-containing protein [Polyangia bacterium]|nr:YtxH domain-containing protein [Polyangia bacterium]
MARDERVTCCHHGSSAGSAATGFIIGALAGGITALLLAPRSGAETRARFRRIAEDSRARAERVPLAVREAREAAVQAFTETLTGSGHGHHPG